MPIVEEDGWRVIINIDDDGHLNIYVISKDGSPIVEIETGQGDGDEGEQLALRFSTQSIECESNDSFICEFCKEMLDIEDSVGVIVNGEEILICESCQTTRGLINVELLREQVEDC